MSGTLNANYVQADVGTNLNLNSGGAVGSVIVANNGSITSTTNGGLLAVGNTLNYTDTGIIASFAGNTASYGYVVVQNQSPANTAYSSYAVYNNTGNYMEIGVNSSNYSYSAAGYANNSLQLANAGFIYAANDMVVGTWGANSIHFVTNGSTSTTDAMNISSTGVTTFANPISAPNTFGFKNRIINGAMMIDQRNAGASVTPAAGSYTLDRFAYQATQASKFTIQQTPSTTETGYATRIASGFTNYLACTVASAVTVGGGDYLFLDQRIEGYNIADLSFGTASAKTITLSFLAYSSLTGTFGGAITNNGSSRNYPFSYSIPVANTWTQISITIPGDGVAGAGAWLTNNSNGMQVLWSLGCGSLYTQSAGAWTGSTAYGATGQVNVVGTSGATFYITGVQLEVGTQATSFDYRPYGTELALCSRYAKVYGGSQFAATGYIAHNASTTAYVIFPTGTPMRTTPSLTCPSPSSVSVPGGYAVSSFNTIYTDTAGSIGAYVTLATGTAGEGICLYTNGTTITLSAEL